MQNLAKRGWGASLTIRESADLMIEWCVKAREKNVLRKMNPRIYYAYVVEDTPPLAHMLPISTAFKYSQKDMPHTDYARDVLLRCLSVALKAHFFIFQDANVAHEPYFFGFPSLEDSTKNVFGLIYKIEKEDKAIIVCEKDLEPIFKSKRILYRFPAVVNDDSFRWYGLKNWAIVKQHALIADKERPWKDSVSHQSAKDAGTKEELAKYATILEVPYDIKDEIKPLGIEWSNKVKVWYLPKGFDVDSVNEYVSYVKKRYEAEQKASSAGKQF